MRSRNERRAFTLVELLVVIGIIAALIGILLPVLSGVQARGRDIKCQSNLRQIVMAFQGYAAENKGSMPYGLYYAPENPQTYEPVGNARFVSWASLVGKYVVKGADGDNLNINFPPVLQCPEAAQQYVHIVGYVANMVAFPGKVYERQALGPGKDIIKPAILTQLFPHNALVWDTSVSNGLENNVGYLLGADLDGQRFWTPDVPQHRYYDPADVYAKLQGGALGNQKPVRFNVGSPVWKNIDPHDPDDGGPGYPYQGNMRFRHNKNTACNVGFADGSVRQYVGKFKGNGEMQSHDAIRKDFMIKWPSGLARNNQVP